KDEKLIGMKLLLVQQIDLEGKATGSYVVAVDSVGAGEGEVVLCAAGSSARQTPLTENKPVDTVIMAIVDTWEVRGDVKYQKYAEES
ncbi:MAG TPA: EutN/CcmL family microcompartment protein, partial [Chroococcales cyanobacterium]